MNPNTNISITIDHREKFSHVPDLLQEAGIELCYKTMKAGDYLVNDQILIERKTANDFALSMLSGRLFRQCSKLRATGLVCLIIVEGNPLDTLHNISAEALQGALLSVMVRWQIPVYMVKDKNETVKTMIRVAAQNMKAESNFAAWQKGGRKTRNSQVYFLRSLPSIGPKLALQLLKTFGSVVQIINASQKELQAVEGIGKQKAEKLYEFFNTEVFSPPSK